MILHQRCHVLSRLTDVNIRKKKKAKIHIFITNQNVFSVSLFVSKNKIITFEVPIRSEESVYKCLSHPPFYRL